MSEETKKYCFSIYNHGEVFEGSYNSREEALEAGIKARNQFNEDNDGAIEHCHIWTAECNYFKPEIDAQKILEMLACEAYDHVGDVDDAAEDWIHGVTVVAKNELGQDLNNALNAWLKKHGLYPSMYNAINEEEHVVEISHTV